MSLLSTKQTALGVLAIGGLGAATWFVVRRRQEANRATVEVFKRKHFTDPRYAQAEESQRRAVTHMLNDLAGKSWQDKLRTAGEGTIVFVEGGFDKEHADVSQLPGAGSIGREEE